MQQLKQYNCAVLQTYSTNFCKKRRAHLRSGAVKNTTIKFFTTAFASVAIIIFTQMQQQLFLFDKPEETKPDAQPQKNEIAVKLLAANDLNTAEKPFAAAQEDETITKEIVESPFAVVQKEHQEKIENMLLLPAAKRGRKSFKDMDAETILVDVPEDEVLFQKRYYSMRTVAEWFGISVSQLRNWENEFDILQPKKNARGDRFFRPEDVKNLQLIYHLIRKRKFTAAGAIQYLNENKKNLRTTMQLTDALAKLKQFLLELRAISE